jgi:hypothetical protein
MMIPQFVGESLAPAMMIPVRPAIMIPVPLRPAMIIPPRSLVVVVVVSVQGCSDLSLKPAMMIPAFALVADIAIVTTKNVVAIQPFSVFIFLISPVLFR